MNDKIFNAKARHAFEGLASYNSGFYKGSEKTKYIILERLEQVCINAEEYTDSLTTSRIYANMKYFIENLEVKIE